MKHKLTIEQRISKLEKLMKSEANDMIAYHDNDNYEPKYIKSAQRVFDIADEIEARIESLPKDFDIIHLDKSYLDAINDTLEKIKSDASMWIN